MPEDIGRTVQQPENPHVLRYSWGKRGKFNIHPQRIFFSSLILSEKYQTVIKKKKKSQKPVFSISEWPVGQLLGSDVITTGINNPQIQREV